MSFITKRERVFNEYDLYDLPSRNEGKLKAYASCTDARAWSHFCTDKTEHLVEIIKRNNETCRPKYLPTDVIVNTLMVVKNAEISRLKHKIEEFEQMLAAYDQLELTSDQKCDIDNAHAAIRAANKELDEMCLDLDLSGFTEGIDSETFETGKSRGDEAFSNLTMRSLADEIRISKGDEWELPKAHMKQESKSNQVGQGEVSCACDVSTSAYDTRIDDMQDTIIRKDAKLNAMQNIIAVMENDVCVPYCIYVHIYTALAKIFGTLCQNGKYKNYLSLLTAGIDIRSLDIKCKILFNMKVLETFCLALIAPCSEDFGPISSTQDYSCYRAEIFSTFALTSAESNKNNIDNRRAQLVADIIENQEMKEILSKDSIIEIPENNTQKSDDEFDFEASNLETESKKRFKNLQKNYDELVNCYDNLKYEKDCLFLKCQRYVELEKECECMQDRLREYNQLWSEKEYYRKRSEDLDTLKERYYILSEETSNIESKLQAESEINKIKCNNIHYLQNENIALEKKLNELTLVFQKEKNSLNCKLKECECKIMCQDQQIKTLSLQIDKFIEQGQDLIEADETSKSLELLNEIESQKEQIKNLRQALLCNEEEKQLLQNDIEAKLQLINELKIEVENWKEKSDQLLHSNICLEKYANDYQNQMKYLHDQNNMLLQEVENKTEALENLKDIIHSKSKEISSLANIIQVKKSKNLQLLDELKSFKNENDVVMNTLKTAQRESHEILANIIDNSYNEADYSKTNNLNEFHNSVVLLDAENQSNNSSVLLNEINKLHEISIQSLHALLDENIHYKESLEITKKESEILEKKLRNVEELTEALSVLTESYDNILKEKSSLEDELKVKNHELDDLINSFQLTKKESEELNQRLNETENLKEDFLKINALYQKLVHDRSILQCELKIKEKSIEDIEHKLKNYKQENERLLEENNRLINFEKKLIDLENDYKHVITEKQDLIKNINAKSQQINQFYNNLERKTEENKQLMDEIDLLKLKETTTQNNITLLENENLYTQNDLTLVRKESEDLKEKLKFFENLQSDFISLQSNFKGLENTYEENAREKHKIQAEFYELQKQLVEITENNKLLIREKLDLSAQCEDLEKALTSVRAAINGSSSTKEFLEEIKLEIDALKKEKIVNHKKIRELADRLDESHALISNLHEDILARDSKIYTLENYINQLEEEVKHLNNIMAVAVESSEQLLDRSHKNMDESLKILDAHHSKATHNMKMELATLKNENSLMENQLSNIKIKSDDDNKEKQKYIEQITDLSSERAITFENIKELEIICFGNSNLYVDMCNIDDIITSLNKIRQCIEAKHSKSTSLEHTLFTVQNSSKLLLSKADEAKKIAENEKQKITLEKEEAIRERLIMEKKLNALESKLKDQMSKDQDIIKDLDAKLLNQKLMFEKIDEVRQNYITKLKNEVHNLEDMYENSLSKIRELQEKALLVSEDNTKKNEEIGIIAKNLEKKTKEVAFLRKCIDDIKNKPNQSKETQTLVFIETSDHSCQTNLSDVILHKEVNNAIITNSHTNIAVDISINQDERKQLIYNKEELLMTNPNIDFIKKAYLNYKIKQLRPTTLEQCTISCDNYVDSLNNIHVAHTSLPNEIGMENKTNALTTFENHHNIIDIYNTHSIFTHNTEFSSKSPGIESTLELSNDNFENVDGVNQENVNKSKFYDISEPSTNNDLFLIYKDSDVNQHNSNQKTSWPDHLQANVVVESVNLQSVKKNTSNSNIKENDLFSNNDDDSVKPKLTLNLPRVGTESLSRETHSIYDNNSIDSYTVAIYASPTTASDIEVNVSETHAERKSVTSLRPKSQLNKNKKESAPELADIINIENNSFRMDKEKKIGEKLFNKDDINSNEPIVKKYITKTSYKTLKKDGNKPSLGENVRPSVIKKPLKNSDYGLKYIMDSVQQEVNIKKIINKNDNIRRSQSTNEFPKHFISNHSRSYSSLLKSLSDYEATTDVDKNITNTTKNRQSSFSIEQGVMVKLDNVQEYENKIKELTKALENIERHYKNKIEAVKTQYDNNIKNIINEHNQGVESIQSLHEETLQDFMRSHEGEIENLRSISIEAMRKVERLEKENNSLRLKFRDKSEIKEEPIKIATDTRKRKHRRSDARTLTTTNIEAFNVRPKPRSHGPCTCTLDANISDTIRTIFEQVDIDQRRLAEHAYTKYIATKIINNNVEALDAQELAFLHLKVCRTWKTMLSEEEVLQKRIVSLENELLNKQRQTKKHIAELDRKVAEERQRLEEVREAVCRKTPDDSRDNSPQSQLAIPEKDVCKCCSTSYNLRVEERLSTGDLTAAQTASTLRPRRPKQESNRAVSAKLDVEERKEKKHYHDEHPIRLRRSHDRPNKHSNKK